MRQKEKGRHWKDDRTLGNRAFFHYKETGMRSETGAMQIASFLTIEALRPEDTGFYRCRVDFKEAPTKNTKIHLRLIGRQPNNFRELWSWFFRAETIQFVSPSSFCRPPLLFKSKLWSSDTLFMSWPALILSSPPVTSKSLKLLLRPDDLLSFPVVDSCCIP